MYSRTLLLAITTPSVEPGHDGNGLRADTGQSLTLKVLGSRETWTPDWLRCCRTTITLVVVVAVAVVVVVVVAVVVAVAWAHRWCFRWLPLNNRRLWVNKVLK